MPRLAEFEESPSPSSESEFMKGLCGWPLSNGLKPCELFELVEHAELDIGCVPNKKNLHSLLSVSIIVRLQTVFSVLCAEQKAMAVEFAHLCEAVAPGVD